MCHSKVKNGGGGSGAIRACKYGLRSGFEREMGVSGADL